MRRQDTIATGGSITGIASRLKQVAMRVDTDPSRIR
jgi:cysteine synthase